MVFNYIIPDKNQRCNSSKISIIKYFSTIKRQMYFWHGICIWLLMGHSLDKKEGFL